MSAFFVLYAGHFAGIATAMLWTGTSISFTAAGKRIGPVAVNAFRIVLALLLLAITHRWLGESWIPDVATRQVLLLAVSGFIGLSIGDQALFISFMDIGPRLATLVMTTSPLFAVFFGWMALGETLSGPAWAGVALTVGGIAWVVMERSPTPSAQGQTHRVRGVIMGLIAGACQAGGLLLSKQGMGHGWLAEDQHLDPQAATLVRMFFAAFGMIPILIIHRVRNRARRAAGVRPQRIGSPRVGYLFAAMGAVFGPFLGVWMSLVAADKAPVGVAQTLCSLTPIFLVPLAALIYKERISPRAALGAVLAVGGAVLLFVPSWDSILSTFT